MVHLIPAYRQKLKLCKCEDIKEVEQWRWCAWIVLTGMFSGLLPTVWMSTQRLWCPPTPSNNLWLANNLNKFYCRFERQYSPAPAHQLHLLHHRKGLGLSIIALLRDPFSPPTMTNHFIWRRTLTDCLRRRTPAKQLDQTLSPPWSIVKISWLWYSSLTLNWRHAM